MLLECSGNVVSAVLFVISRLFVISISYIDNLGLPTRLVCLPDESVYHIGLSTR
jgi:hypothetical protein